MDAGAISRAEATSELELSGGMISFYFRTLSDNSCIHKSEHVPN